MQKQKVAKTLARIRTSCGFNFTLDCHDFTRCVKFRNDESLLDSSDYRAEVFLGDFQGNFVLWVFEREAMR